MAQNEAAYERFVWRQTEPGVWQRGVDELEYYYSSQLLAYQGATSKPLYLISHLVLQFDQPADSSVSSQDAEARANEALRKAWDTLRYNHPTIASQVVRDAETGDLAKVYRNNDPAAFASTFVVLPSHTDADEWANSDPPAPALPTLFVIPTPTEADRPIRRELFLRVGHEIIDGVGLAIFFGNLVKLVAKAYEQGADFVVPTCDGSEVSRLSPPLRVASNMPAKGTEAQQKRLAGFGAEWAATQAPAGTRTLTIPYKKGETVPGPSQVAAATLSAEKTSQLAAACKAAGVSITHAYHAAVPMVLLDLHESERGADPVPMRYSSLMPRNERPACLPPYNTAEHPAALYHSVSPLFMPVDVTLPAAGDEAGASPATRRSQYRDVLQTLKGYYESFRKDPDFVFLGFQIWGNLFPLPPLGAAGPPPVPPFNPEPGVGLSSMGKVDAFIPAREGAVEVFDVWWTGEEAGATFNGGLVGFRGESTLTVAYNKAWHEKEEVVDFLKRCQREVLWQFDIPVEA
ncbi:hypothetical protein SODALDRAFT_113169 [Sodiomyces alkalinus F11]|uniref:Uncharacterized protein n=1 Tax=Sodiomyces alkalinus (strain CBS 110278 / VKM F-3762 / F11) TaxID=1314773 RepID=A0A3N2Q357_SODAK|nr:hypothetical protein SODALDRAFT_113169 [Sodiomyces alkalinus F11]ROT41156.1 hypothetical protein SODALDRAFT_113169 [Sodiomyces alkalinus F11]